MVLRAGPMSRSDLASITGVNPSTIARCLPDLLNDGWLQEDTKVSARRTRGRPTKQLRPRLRHHLAIGIKIGPELLTGAAVDLAAQPLARGRRVLTDRDPDHVLEAVASLATELATIARETTGPDAAVLGVGLGVGGPVESNGVCRTSHIMGWTDVDVTTPVARRTGFAVVANNDVNTLAAAHHWYGFGRSVDDLAVVTIGCGIGSGLVIGAELQVGHGGSAGEFGHIPLDPDGPTCACGSRGCLESLASEAAILRMVRADPGHGHVESVDEVISLAERGDAVALAAFRSAGEALGRGIATLSNLLNPELVILAGELTRAVSFIEPAVREAAARYAFARSWSDCRLVIDRSGNDMWARGAACLAIRSAVQSPASMVYVPRGPLS
jgi:predicted NBD/HSP70 family sugar kinase